LTVIADASTSSLNIVCGSSSSDYNCQYMTVTSTATTLNLDCESYYSCYSAVVNVDSALSSLAINCN
jgi:hypothetical protein